MNHIKVGEEIARNKKKWRESSGPKTVSRQFESHQYFFFIGTATSTQTVKFVNSLTKAEFLVIPWPRSHWPNLLNPNSSSSRQLSRHRLTPGSQPVTTTTTRTSLSCLTAKGSQSWWTITTEREESEAYKRLEIIVPSLADLQCGLEPDFTHFKSQLIKWKVNSR